jgi:hypothetical protein
MADDTNWMDMFYSTDFQSQPSLFKEEKSEMSVFLGMDISHDITPVEALVVGEKVVVVDATGVVAGVNSNATKRSTNPKRSDKIKVSNRGSANRSRQKKVAYIHDIETQLAASKAKVEQLEAYILQMGYKM